MSATSVAAPTLYADQPDDELILCVRSGDYDAYAELWRRYFPLAVAVARRSTSRFDPEDLASEAFLTVFSAIRNGSGPVYAFRVYLMTVVRNMSAKWGSRQMEIALEDPYEAVPPPPVDGLAALERDPRMVAASPPTRPQCSPCAAGGRCGRRGSRLDTRMATPARPHRDTYATCPQ